jgi:hypothetical protein
MSNTISGIFGRDNRNYQPEAEPDQGLRAYGQNLDLKSAATGKSVLGNYDFKSNPDEVITKLKEEFHAATDSLESYLAKEEDVPFFKRKLPNIEFNVEAKEATVRLMNALNADYDSRGKNSYLLTDEGKDLMRRLVSYLPLTSETDDEELKQAQNSSFALLSKQLANTKSSGRLDTASRDLVLRMQAPVYARDDQRRYNLALTLMRSLGPKEFAKPAEKNGEFINVYKRIQDAFAIGGDKEIGKEFARNIHEIISPILEGPIDHDLEKNLGESAVKAIKEMRAQVWVNAEDLMLSSTNISKLTPKAISYRGADGVTKTEQLRDPAEVLRDLVQTIKELYIDNKFEASENLELIVRDLAYEAHEYGMKAADAKSLKGNLRSAITGEAGRMTPVAVPVASLNEDQQKTALSDMLFQSATRVQAAQAVKSNLGSVEIDTMPDNYSVARVKLQSEIAKKMATLSSDSAIGKYQIGGQDVSLSKTELQAVSDAINGSTLVSKSDVETLITQQGNESDDRVAQKKKLLAALLNEDRLSQISAADKVINAESKAFDKIVQKASAYEKSGEAELGLNGIVKLAEALNSYKTDDKLDLQKLAGVGRDSAPVIVDAGKVLIETGNTEVAFQLINNSEGKKLGNELLKVVQEDLDKYTKLHKQATKDADNVVATVVSSLNKAGLTSVAHRLVESFHEFITSGDPESGEINSERMKDILSKDNSASGGLGDVASRMADYIGSKQTAQDTQLAMLKNEQAERLQSHASKASFGRTTGMNDSQILDRITGQTSGDNKENAIAHFIEFANSLYTKTKEQGNANAAFNISEEDVRKLLVVDKGDNLSLAERDIHLKKIMLTVLNGLNNDRSNTNDVVAAKERLVREGVIALPGVSEINKFSKESGRIANNFESKISELEFSTVGKTKYDSFDELLMAEQNNDGSGSGGYRSDATDFLKRMVGVFTKLFIGNKSDAISAYLAGVVDKVKDDSTDAFNNGLHAALQP